MGIYKMWNTYLSLFSTFALVIIKYDLNCDCEGG